MCLIVVLSIVSIVVITRKSNFTNPRNFMLIFLATSDLAIGVLVIPNVIFLTLNNSLVGGYICKACMFAEYMAVVAHTLTITALALDRFLAIRFPMKSRILRRRENYLFVIGAICSFLFCMDSVVSFCISRSRRKWSREIQQKQCTRAWFLIIHLISTSGLWLSTLYCCLFFHLWYLSYPMSKCPRP